MPHLHAGVPMTRLRTATAVVSVLAVVEFGVGTATGSLALRGDAGHLLTDAVALALVWYAARAAGRPASAAHSFGHRRTGILVAALNGLLLGAVAIGIAISAALRFAHPATVSGGPVLAMAALALLVNIVLAFSLRDPGSLSVRSAFLHLIADALTAVGVMASAVLILTLHWQTADPLASLLIAGLIAIGAAGLLRNSARILIEATPADIDTERVQETIVATPGVEGVHDLHIWALDDHHRALSAHVSVESSDLVAVSGVLLTLERRLCADFSIDHVTLQPECGACGFDTVFCDPDERHAALHAGGDATTR